MKTKVLAALCLLLVASPVLAVQNDHNSIPDPGEYGRVLIPYSDGQVPITPTMTDWLIIFESVKTQDVSLMTGADKVLVESHTMVKVLQKVQYAPLVDQNHQPIIMFKVRVMEGKHKGYVGYIYSKFTFWLYCNETKSCEDLLQ